MPPPRRVAVIAFAAVILVALTAGVSAAADTATATPRCDGVKLRSAPSTGAAIRLVTSVGTQLTISGAVQGSSYSSLCAGEIRSGSSWDRVTAVDGTSVQSRFGVAALYVAAELVQVTGPAPTPVAPSPTPTPVVTPTPTPTTTPTPTPTAPPATSAPSSPTASPALATPLASPSATPSHATQPAPAGTTQGPWSSLGIAVLALAALSLVVSLLVIGDHLRIWRRPRSSDVDGVSPSRLEDVLH